MNPNNLSDGPCKKNFGGGQIGAPDFPIPGHFAHAKTQQRIAQALACRFGRKCPDECRERHLRIGRRQFRESRTTEISRAACEEYFHEMGVSLRLNFDFGVGRPMSRAIPLDVRTGPTPGERPVQEGSLSIEEGSHTGQQAGGFLVCSVSFPYSKSWRARAAGAELSVAIQG